MTRRRTRVLLIFATVLVACASAYRLSGFSAPEQTDIRGPEATAAGKSAPDTPTGFPDVEIKGGGLPPGCVCHSKIPEFLTMHNRFSVEDCRKCHGENEKLMGKAGGEMTEERKAALEERRRKEAICRACHK